MTRLTGLGRVLLALLAAFDIACGGYALWETLQLGQTALTTADPSTMADVQGQATLGFVSYYVQLIATGLLGILVINAAALAVIFGLCLREGTARA
jgi:hypothetical protein